MSAYALPRENPGLNQTRVYAKVKRNAPNQPEPSIIIKGASIVCKVLNEPRCFWCDSLLSPGHSSATLAKV